MTGEINLLARFPSADATEACAQALRQQGFDILQIRSLPLPTEEDLGQAPVAEWGRWGYHPDLVDDKWTQTTTEARHLLPDGEAWQLSAVVPEDRSTEVAHLIQHYGGTL